MAFSLAVVLLAAGRSSRMGRPKLLLPWSGTSVLGHLIDQWQALKAEQVAVVSAADDSLIQAELDRLGFSANDRVLNAAPERGMFSSIQCAAQWPGWRADLTHWAIVLGDQPHISRETLQTIVAFSAANPERICLPKQGGHRRHPVVLPRQLFVQLPDCEAIDLKAFLESLPIPAAICELNDPALELDIDTPDDYDRAVKLYQIRLTRPISPILI
jgi:molybdenum cofactor cytidylyltransferase